MFNRKNPFSWDENMSQCQEYKVLEQDVMYPTSMSPLEVQLVSALLEKDPLKRLGCPPQPEEAIKLHEYFEDIDWEALERKEVSPPFIPKVETEEDWSNFDEEFTKECPSVFSGEWRSATVRSRSSIEIYKEKFRGFSFTNEDFQ